jgi:ubiquinone/menaquinone biosynthesis C-methylase UbiE
MDQIKSFYESDASMYDAKRFASGKHDDAAHQELVGRFLDSLPTGARIVEIGCGTGQITRTLLKHDQEFTVTAVDFAANMLQTLNRANTDTVTSDQHYHSSDRERSQDDQSLPRLTLLQGDCTRLPFASDSFDACVMINIVNHLPDPIAAFNDLRRVVRPDGQLFTNIPNLYSPYFPIALYINYRERSLQEDVYSHWYGWSERRRLFEQTGWQVTETNGHMVTPRSIHSVLDRFMGIVDDAVRDSVLKHLSGTVFVTAQHK